MTELTINPIKEQEKRKETTIYALYPKSKKNAILLVGGCIALLTPFTDTIYLPALKSVGTSLHASDASVAGTVSAYLGAVGKFSFTQAKIQIFFSLIALPFALFRCWAARMGSFVRLLWTNEHFTHWVGAL